MRLFQKETIQPDPDSSFHVLVNPRLNHLFYWHFHPEYELVFIEGASGTRHVGEHLEPYHDSDLVLIGSNIPHLNFDYGVNTNYEKIVLHIQPQFHQRVFADIPELTSIYSLFERSRYGITFHGQTKQIVGRALRKFVNLDPFDQFLAFLQIFKKLAETQEYRLLHKDPYVNRYSRKVQNRLLKIYAYVEKHYQSQIDLSSISRVCHLSKPAFCRYFKKTTGQTFTEYLQQYRISQAKRHLLEGNSVGEACFRCGFESLSYFNRIFKKVVGENPSSYKIRLQKHQQIK